MAVTDRLFAGSIPEIYDRLLVPLIFESYARDLAERAAKVKPRDVLETAAGTGALTRAIASRLPAHARIVATDLNQPMLEGRKGPSSWKFSRSMGRWSRLFRVCAFTTSQSLTQRTDQDWTALE